MTDLNIPNLNKKSDKYIFKKKLSLRRKSRKRLFIESSLMLISSLILIYLNYLIPNKNLLFQNLPTTLGKTSMLFFELFSNLYEIFLVLFIIFSFVIIIILSLGSFYRLFRIGIKKTRKISYK